MRQGGGLLARAFRQGGGLGSQTVERLPQVGACRSSAMCRFCLIAKHCNRLIAALAFCNDAQRH